jgi:hypothetical protein
MRSDQTQEIREILQVSISDGSSDDDLSENSDEIDSVDLETAAVPPSWRAYYRTEYEERVRRTFEAERTAAYHESRVRTSRRNPLPPG